MPTTEETPQSPKLWGASWIQPGDYAELLAMMPADMPPSYEAWLAGATGRIESAKADGYIVYRAPLRPAPFKAWCEANGHALDRHSRQAFATDEAHWDRDVLP